jgi:hypothetical protein
MSNPLSRSLNVRLIVLFVAMSVVSMAALTVVSFNSAQAALGNKIHNELHSLAVSRAEAVKIVDEMRMQQAATFAAGDKVQNLFGAYNSGGSANGAQLKEASDALLGEFSRFKEATGGQDGFYKIKAVSSDGTVFLSSDASEVGKSVAQDANFQKAGSQCCL